jgi:hypothetical protein
MAVQIEIKAHKGTFITLDEEDAEKIGKWGWVLRPDGYVSAHLPKSGSSNTTGKKVKLSHAVIWARTGEWPPADMDVDHVNGVKLDNRMVNLRVVTTSVNCKNRNKNEGASSQLQGVFWNKKSQKWFAVASVRIGGKKTYINSSLTPDEVIAGKCADVIRLLIGGWHPSKLNFPELTFFDKWYHIGKGQQEQILHSLEKNNIPIDPLSPYRSWYRAA